MLCNSKEEQRKWENMQLLLTFLLLIADKITQHSSRVFATLPLYRVLCTCIKLLTVPFTWQVLGSKPELPEDDDSEDTVADMANRKIAKLYMVQEKHAVSNTKHTYMHTYIHTYIHT